MGLIPVVDEMDRILSFVFGAEEELSQLTDILIIDYSFIGILLSTTIVVLAPFGEELLFRGFLQKKIRRVMEGYYKGCISYKFVFCIYTYEPGLDNTNISSRRYSRLSCLENGVYSNQPSAP